MKMNNHHKIKINNKIENIFFSCKDHHNLVYNLIYNLKKSLLYRLIYL